MANTKLVTQEQIILALEKESDVRNLLPGDFEVLLSTMFQRVKIT